MYCVFHVLCVSVGYVLYVSCVSVYSVLLYVVCELYVPVVHMCECAMRV